MFANIGSIGNIGFWFTSNNSCYQVYQVSTYIFPSHCLILRTARIYKLVIMASNRL